MATDFSKMSDADLDRFIAHAGQSAPRADELLLQPWTPELVRFLTVSLLVFGLAIIGMMTYLVLKQKDASDILRLFTLPMVIIASVILVILGYSNEQMTPVIGLLGTMVGYILGVNRRTQASPPEPRLEESGSLPLPTTRKARKK